MEPTDSTTRGSILVVDDEPLKRITLQIELAEAGYQVYETAEPNAALRTLDSKPVDVVVTDLKMPGMDGLTFLEHVKQRRPDVHVILMTAFGTVDTAVAAMKRGAYDYLTKPFKTEVLLSKIEDLLAYRRSAPTPVGEPAADGVSSGERLGRLVGHSHAMQALFSQIRTVANGDQTLLIRGESGTGKELVAEAIHQLSRRAEQPLIKCNCAALQPDLVESELFGHEQGAFPSAVRRKAGRFELAGGGTLFLDEVSGIPTETQIKVLRALEQQTFERMGGQEGLPVRCRLICATRHDLHELINGQRFRRDLYYRLNVVTLSVPPLRDRREDIPALVADLLENSAAAPANAVRPTLSPHALDLLVRHHWPGNVRELEHALEHALAFSSGAQIRPEDLPPLGEDTGGGEHVIPFAETAAGLTETVATIERQMINSALIQSEYNQAKAAQLLGIPRTTLRDKIAKYRLGSPPPAGGPAAGPGGP